MTDSRQGCPLLRGRRRLCSGLFTLQTSCKGRLERKGGWASVHKMRRNARDPGELPPSNRSPASPSSPGAEIHRWRMRIEVQSACLPSLTITDMQVAALTTNHFSPAVKPKSERWAQCLLWDHDVEKQPPSDVCCWESTAGRRRGGGARRGNRRLCVFGTRSASLEGHTRGVSQGWQRKGGFSFFTYWIVGFFFFTMYAYYLFKKLNLKNKNPTNSQNLKAVKLESASHVQRAWSRRSPQRESFSGREESTFKIRIFVLFFFGGKTRFFNLFLV